jgi:hypothetical protein
MLYLQEITKIEDYIINGEAIDSYLDYNSVTVQSNLCSLHCQSRPLDESVPCQFYIIQEMITTLTVTKFATALTRTQATGLLFFTRPWNH